MDRLQGQEFHGSKWWLPLKEADPKFEVVEKDLPAVEIGPLGSSRWMAGQARPATALRLNSGDAGDLAGFAALGAAVSLSSLLGGVGAIASVFSGAASLGAVASFIAANYAIACSVRPLGAGIQSLSSHAWGAGSMKRAAKVSITGVASEVAGNAGALLSFVGVGKVSQFSRSCFDLAHGYKARSLDLDAQGLSSLTEIGAWRLASSIARQGKPVEAARVWMERPFNPDWRVRLARSTPGGCKWGDRIAFREFIELSAKAERRREIADHLADVARAMDVASERVAVGQSSAESKPAPRGRSGRI